MGSSRSRLDVGLSASAACAGALARGGFQAGTLVGFAFGFSATSSSDSATFWTPAPSEASIFAVATGAGAGAAGGGLGATGATATAWAGGSAARRAAWREREPTTRPVTSEATSADPTQASTALLNGTPFMAKRRALTLSSSRTGAVIGTGTAGAPLPSGTAATTTGSGLAAAAAIAARRGLEEPVAPGGAALFAVDVGGDDEILAETLAGGCRPGAVKPPGMVGVGRTDMRTGAGGGFWDGSGGGGGG